MENDHLTLQTWGSSILSPDTLTRYGPSQHWPMDWAPSGAHPQKSHARKEVLELPIMSEQ